MDYNKNITYCSNCGEENNIRAMYCRSCGEKLRNKKEMSNKEFVTKILSIISYGIIAYLIYIFIVLTITITKN